MRKILKESLYVILFFLFMTLFLTWPLALNLEGFLLSSAYEDISHSDTTKQIGMMLESNDRFMNNLDFIIVEQKFAMPPSYMLLGIFSVSLLKLDPTVFHNLFFLISMFLAGLFMYLLMMEWTKDRFSSVFGGFLFMSSNFLMHQYMWGHANILQIQWIPLIFLFLERLLLSKKLKYSLYLGLVLAVQVISSLQFSVYLTFIIPLYLILRYIFFDKKFVKEKDVWLNLFLSAILGLAFSSFYLIKRFNLTPQVRTIKENLIENRSVESLSVLFNPNSHVSIGWFTVVLVLIGISLVIWHFQKREYRKYGLFGILFVFFLLCLLGPVSVFVPYYWLYKLWPLVDYFRTPVRVYPFLSLCLSFLASLIFLTIKNKKLKWIILIIFLVIFFLFQIQDSHYFVNTHIFYL